MKKMTLWMAAVLFAAWAMADVRLDPVFTSNMMLQQGAPIAFFGTAPAEKDVTATFGDEFARTVDGLERRGLVALTDGGMRPTQRGWLLGNEVFGALWSLAPSSVASL